jgi:type IV fimbrial biogenesis protein FimT
MLKPVARGMTLVEVMVGLAVISCLLLVGMPSFSSWIQDLQIRGAAESVQSALLLARSEAIRRNRPVRLQLKDAGGLVEWEVGCVTVATDCPASIARRSRNEGGRNARMAVGAMVNAASLGSPLAAGSGLPASLDFNGLGAIIGTVPGRIEISHAALGSARRLVLLIGSGGLIRLCNPALARDTSPQGCA